MTEIPRLPEGRTLTSQERNRIADAWLDAIEAAKLAMYEDQFRRPVPDVAGIPPWREASAEWLAAQPTIDELQDQLDDS